MELRVGDRVHRVDVRAEGADWVVTFDGQVRRVSMVRSGASWSLLIRDGSDAADGSRELSNCRSAASATRAAVRTSAASR